MLKKVTDYANRGDNLASTRDELVVEGTQRMLLAALEAEVADYIDRHRKLRNRNDRRLLVRTCERRSRRW